jgi:hypothetical protein
MYIEIILMSLHFYIECSSLLTQQLLVGHAVLSMGLSCNGDVDRTGPLLAINMS